jgi:ADP-ribosylglycohydrolase
MDTRASAQPVIQRETIAVGVNARSDQRLARARAALDGLSVGDAFGERFFAPLSIVMGLVEQRALPRPPWEYTDDTQMALSIVEVLRRFDGIDQDALARSFADHFELARGYGPAMYRLLPAIRRGEPWRETARALFAGQGSFGNGAAMRIAPLGAYFADDPPAAVDHARCSAEVTHAHPEAAAGAIAVAAAAAAAARSQGTRPPAPRDLLDAIASQVPASAVRDGIERARDLPPDAAVETAAATLGNGGRVTAQDTVPFVLWSATRHLGDYEAALWATVRAFGDVDTNCAMVGGVVASYTGSEGIPPEWLRAREPLPAWVLADSEG